MHIRCLRLLLLLLQLLLLLLLRAHDTAVLLMYRQLASSSGHLRDCLISSRQIKLHSCTCHGQTYGVLP
jgi:hypothetical protein